MPRTHNAPEGSETSGAPERVDQTTAIVTQRPDTLGMSRAIAAQHVITTRRRDARAFDEWAVRYYGVRAAREAGIRYAATRSDCACCCRCSAVSA